jgi:hypothetical protein
MYAKTQKQQQQQQQQQNVTFAYCGKEVRRITKILKDRQLRIAFRTQNY